ncbi:phosphotransferase [Schauerella aestuarii]|uniref:phosphotransferase n=1 Tax=Schauerella aestuarii TaxID=2511204 RepID=UPI001368EFD9|nr:phosphotransferase [Achromobacter aestuarii]MYZ42822.1 phosphotransferase family protein [Achromobacter aestuarii]
MSGDDRGTPPIWREALLTYLAQHDVLPGGIEDARITPIAGGQSNPTYLIAAGGDTVVLRKQPPGQLLPSAHAVDREYRVMQALQATPVPVPRMHHYCASREIVGTPFYLMDFVPGRTFMDPALPDLKPPERGAVYAEVGRVLAALHDVDVAAVGLADYGRAGNYFERQIARWSRQYRETETAPIAAMDALIDWLPQRIPAHEATCLVHGDYRIDNLIFAADRPQALALLDWELSTLGHPFADLAYHCMCWRVGSELWRGFAGSDLNRLGIPDEATFVATYCQARGIAPPDDWDFYLAYSFFRIAAILQGVYARAKAGNAASGDGAAMGAKVAPLAALGWQAAERCGA